jgi:alpha-beta hydrolase superfamily lysophospholipase
VPATTSELEARTADGVTLRIDRVPARGVRRGAVVCLHAMMTDSRYFGAQRSGMLVEAFAVRGFDAYVPDFRGHGRSVPPHARGGTWSFDDLVELDLPAIVEACATASGDTPDRLVIVGHSMGGLVASAALATGRIPPPRELVLAATGMWLGGGIARRALMATYRAVARRVGFAPIRALRAGNADESTAYVEQLTGWVLRGRWVSRTGIDYLAALANIRTPTRAYLGTSDWLCKPADTELIRARIPGAAPLRMIDGADHFSLITRSSLPIADETR